MVRHDLRYTARLLRRAPLFTLSVVLTLALGIGATTTIFSVVDAVILRPLPFAESSRLVWVAERNDRLNLPRFSASAANYVSWKPRTHAFDEMGAIGFGSYNLGGDGRDAEQVSGGPITPSVLPVLGLQPIRGRAFRPGDDVQGAARVAMISDGLWRRRFARDPAAIGRHITINTLDVEIVGVAPVELTLVSPGDLWVPLNAAATGAHPPPVAAGLLGRSLLELQRQPVGFTPDHLLTFQVSPPGSRYALDAGAPVFYRTLIESLRALPGVTGAAVSSGLPFGNGNYTTTPMVAVGPAAVSADTPSPIDWRIVSPDFVGVMNVPLLGGRLFTETDRGEAANVTIVSQATARRFWGDADPIGRVILRIADRRESTVIGVVLGLVVREGMTVGLAGIGLGLAGALALGRTIASLVFGVRVYDPATLAAVTVMLAAVALAACAVPAARASRVDPQVALKGE